MQSLPNVSDFTDLEVKEVHYLMGSALWAKAKHTPSINTKIPVLPQKDSILQIGDVNGRVISVGYNFDKKIAFVFCESTD